MEKGNPSMGMLRIHGYPVTPLPPLSLYPVFYPAPLPRYPFTPKDLRCESL